MFRDTNWRMNVIASVIASVIFVAFIQPFLSFFWEVTVRISNNIYSGFFNSLYRNVAMGQRNYISYLIFLVAVYILFLFMTYLFLKSLGEMWPILTRNPLRSIKGRLNKKQKVIVDITFYIILVLLLLLWVTPIFVELQYNTSFEQRLTVLAPHITDQEMKEVRALWASMESRRDYEATNAMMESLAKEHKVELPEPLLR